MKYNKALWSEQPISFTPYSGLLTKFRKAIIIFVISVCPIVFVSVSPRIEQLGSHWTFFKNEI
jgi:hypothetical protein